MERQVILNNSRRNVEIYWQKKKRIGKENYRCGRKKKSNERKCDQMGMCKKGES